MPFMIAPRVEGAGVLPKPIFQSPEMEMVTYMDASPSTDHDVDAHSPPKPSYRFTRAEPPNALAHLRRKKVWCVWKYLWNGTKWTKPPHSWRTGYKAAITDQTNWCTFEQALTAMKKLRLDGIGIVLDAAGYTGVDLDRCITDSGAYTPLAAEIVEYGETYAEVSPSGEGIHFLAQRADKTIKRDDLGIEVYTTGRYFTVTGDKIEGVPDTITPAPQTIEQLVRLDAETPKPMKNGKASPLNGSSRSPHRSHANSHARPSGGDFWKNVNTEALKSLDSWVPILHPKARKEATGAWRVSSKDLGRDLEEDLSYHPNGITDFGEEHGGRPIDYVIKYGPLAKPTPTEAAYWLCQRMFVEPTALGWMNGSQAWVIANRHAEQADDNQADDGAQAKPKSNAKLTQADTLVQLATGDGIELFHAADGKTYADVILNNHRETWPIKSTGFRRWLQRAYYEETGSAPNRDALSNAMGVIEARAHFDGVERQVFLRVANVGDRIYLDLCDATWRAVEITPDGWHILDCPPVRFRRSNGMLPLPTPVRGGEVDELRQYLRVGDDDYVLVVSWLLAVLLGKGPYPILGLTGEQGTGKSIAATHLRALADPNTAALRTLPRDTRDLYVAAINAYMLVFDNLSGISADVSDALCRLSTGGGFSTRSLFTDDDEVLFDGRRPIAMTSITDVANRSDLADRLLMVRLERIPDDERRPEEELHTSFEAARPRILGALLDVVAHGLAQLPDTRLNRYPRMADYARWIRACETAIWSAGMHMAAYEANRGDAVELVLDADPVGTAIRQHMVGRTEHSTTASALLTALNALVGDHVRRSREWPRSARGLSGQLTRLAPALRGAGIHFDMRRSRDQRVIRFFRESVSDSHG